MTQAVIRSAQTHPAAVAALVIAAVGAATILGAYYFQYVLGLQPCPLCFQQRIPYYVAIPLAAAVAVAAAAGAPRSLVLAGLGLLVVAWLVSAGLGVYHAGVEWRWWVGPTDCAGPISDLSSGGGLLSQLQTLRPVRCDEAAWRFLGLSLAGYNVLISLALALVALWGIAQARRA